MFIIFLNITNIYKDWLHRFTINSPISHVCQLAYRLWVILLGINTCHYLSPLSVMSYKLRQI